ncbi:MAG: DivIVA domain-containing protein [Oscillospiraceae bacterium]
MFAIEDIATAEFDKVMRGYRPEAVHAYLEQVAAQMEKMQSEREDVEKKLYILAQKVEEYRKEEDMLKTAMLNAQRMGESVIREAKQKADSIVREADLKANLIETKAKDKVAEQEEEFALLQAKISKFKNEVLAIYKLHIQSLSELPSSEDDTQEELENQEPVEDAAINESVADNIEYEQETVTSYIPHKNMEVKEDIIPQQPIFDEVQDIEEIPQMPIQQQEQVEKPMQFQPVFGAKPINNDAFAQAEHQIPRETTQSTFAVLGMEPKNFAFDNTNKKPFAREEKPASADGSIFDQYDSIDFNE